MSPVLTNDARWIDGEAPAWEGGQSFGLVWPQARCASLIRSVPCGQTAFRSQSNTGRS